jgi:hypothetical protein
LGGVVTMTAEAVKVFDIEAGVGEDTELEKENITF